MSSFNQAYRNLNRWAQLSPAHGVQLVRIIGHASGNVYTARGLEFDEEGVCQESDPQELTVVNLAELASSPGVVTDGTNAIAVDVEGKWVIFIPPASSAIFLAKVAASHGSAVYIVLEQMGSAATGFADRPGAVALSAQNLAELNAGSGSAVEVGTMVLVQTVEQEGNPPSLRYVFDHPVYAKYR